MQSSERSASRMRRKIWASLAVVPEGNESGSIRVIVRRLALPVVKQRSSPIFLFDQPTRPARSLSAAPYEAHSVALARPVRNESPERPDLFLLQRVREQSFRRL